ncbi:hypothetical protein [Winogradskyella helgolandensis]|uniref:hypothetical protein n=1 Tax=Winogradskyella helgolandensis TaxID=2697010 RepID=UPI0015BDEEE0|nr:hypothetical protein [Winogradskyella helgolandensis]
MKKMIEDLFDLFFPKDIDENGNDIENPVGDDSYTTKVFTIVMLIIIIILGFIGLK